MNEKQEAAEEGEIKKHEREGMREAIKRKNEEKKDN